MAIDLSGMLIDSKKDSEGVRFDLGSKDSGAFIVAARPGNPRAIAEHVRLTRKHAAELKHGDSLKIESEITAKVWFRAIFVDWQGIEIRGEEFAYTEENCIKLFTDPSLDEICRMFTGIVRAGVENGDFREFIPTAEESEEIVKN